MSGHYFLTTISRTLGLCACFLVCKGRYPLLCVFFLKSVVHRKVWEALDKMVFNILWSFNIFFSVICHNPQSEPHGMLGHSNQQDQGAKARKWRCWGETSGGINSWTHFVPSCQVHGHVSMFRWLALGQQYSPGRESWFWGQHSQHCVQGFWTVVILSIRWFPGSEVREDSE